MSGLAAEGFFDSIALRFANVNSAQNDSVVMDELPR